MTAREERRSHYAAWHRRIFSPHGSPPGSVAGYETQETNNVITFSRESSHALIAQNNNEHNDRDESLSARARAQ